MNKIIKIIFLIAVFLCLALPLHSHAENLEGWGKTRWNMTTEELTSLLPGRIEKIEEREINLKKTKIGNLRIGIRLILNDNKLIKVMLDAITNRKISNYNSNEYIEFKGLLIQKYGEPDISKTNRMEKTGWLLSTETHWFLGSTTITLYDFGSSFFAAYAPTNIKDTGDL